MQVLCQVIFAEPADVGFTCVARRRVWTVLVRKNCGKFIREPQSIYNQLCSGLDEGHLTMEELSKVVRPEDLKAELATSGKTMAGYPNNILTPFERTNLQGYESCVDKDRPDEPHDQQAFCINQNPTKFWKASKDGVLPAITKGDRLVWLRGPKRHQLAMEKFAAHGWGVTDELAGELRTPVFWLHNLWHHKS